MKKIKPISLFLCFVLWISLFATVSVYAQPEGDLPLTDEMPLSETILEDSDPEAEDPQIILDEIPVPENADDAGMEELPLIADDADDPGETYSGSIELSGETYGEKSYCWLDGTTFCFTADEENLDCYALEIWEHNTAINVKLFRFYFYPRHGIINIISRSSEMSDSYYQVNKHYDVHTFITEQEGIYRFDVFECFQLIDRMQEKIEREYKYMCCVEARYTDGSDDYSTTPWYYGAELLGQLRPFYGTVKQLSPVVCVNESVTYDYSYMNVKDPELLHFQWQRADSKNFEAVGYENIPGETGDHYTVREGDRGRYIRLTITADGFAGELNGIPMLVTDGVPLTEAYFPDYRFRTALEPYDNYPKDGHLNTVELKKITSLDLPMSSIESIDGIKYLAFLEEVNLTQNAISQADFSGMQCLRAIDLSWNSIDTLNLENCPALEALSLANNMGLLRALEFSQNPQIRLLDIINSGITRLNLRTAPLLRQTALYGNITDEDGNTKVPGTPSYLNTNSVYTWNDCSLKMTESTPLLIVEIANFYSEDFPCEKFREMLKKLCNDKDGWLSLEESQGLKYINFADADPYEVTSLIGIEYFPWLERLMSGEEWRVGIADLSMNKELTILDLGGNPLEYISIMENKALEELNLKACNLKTIDISQNFRLQSAELGFNKLESIKMIPKGLSNRLRELYVENNQLTDSFDISAQPFLEKLYCYGNQITKLDVTSNPFLKDAVSEGTKTTVSTPFQFDRYSLEEKDYDLRVDIGTDVLAVEITGLSLPKTFEIPATKTATLTPTFKPSNTSQTDLTWKSSDTSVVTVDQNGKIKGIKRGIATVTATSKANSKLKAICKVTVKFKDAYYNLNGTGESTVTEEMEAAINWAADRKITGVAVAFGTKNSMTRGQFVRFLYRYAGNPKVTSSMIQKYGSQFKDVDKSYIHFKAIVWAVSKGLINGYTENGKQVFKPEKSLSRNNVATILWKFAGSPKVSNPNKPFKDVAKSKALAWGKEKKIFTAVNGGNFYPKKNCLRGDFAVFLYRYNKMK